jgi:hypothetical protein
MDNKYIKITLEFLTLLFLSIISVVGGAALGAITWLFITSFGL